AAGGARKTSLAVRPGEGGDPGSRSRKWISLDDCLHDIDRAAKEHFGSLRGAECRMGRQCHVLKFRQRMIRRQRLMMEDVQSRVPDVTAFQRRYARGFVSYGLALRCD